MTAVKIQTQNAQRITRFSVFVHLVAMYTKKKGGRRGRPFNCGTNNVLRNYFNINIFFTVEKEPAWSL